MLFSRVKITEPQDAPAIAPDTVSVTWADKVLADISRDASSIQPEIRPGRESAPSKAVTAAPAVDTTFRAIAVGAHTPPPPVEMPPPPAPKTNWLRKVTFIFMFALVSACATGLWKHYGHHARQTIAEWSPLISDFLPQFVLASSPGTDAAASSEQVAAADQSAAPVEPTAATDPAPAVSDPTATASTSAPETSDQMQAMQRDLAALGQQVEQLKATIAELKANQPPSSVVARTPEARPVETKQPPATPARPRVSAVQPPPQPRPVTPPPVRRPPPVQASAAPMQLSSSPPPSVPPPPSTADDGGPVVRPPMSLRYNGANE